MMMNTKSTGNGFKNDLKHELGVISMARTDEPNSGSSQFFLCVNNCEHLDKNYAGFGKILQTVLDRKHNRIKSQDKSPSFDFSQKNVYIRKLFIKIQIQKNKNHENQP